MEIHGILYEYEHRLIPRLFYRDGLSFMNNLIENGNALPYSLLSFLFKERKTDNPYSESDIEVETAEVCDEYTSVRLVYPNPQTEPLCFCCYLFADADGEKLRCYTVEKSSSLFDGTEEQMLCGWDENMRHQNYGTVSADNNEIYKKCVEIFMFD
ncbi:hypothetical protein IJT93_12950 [bacterium]|nr:hypothetical protein [bacterium]